MRRGDVDRFFRDLARRLRIPVRIYLTGGVASWLWGGKRPTEDIDFGLKAPKARWQEVETAIRQSSLSLGIAVQFAEDISRWGMIGVEDFEKGATLHRHFGSISVYLLDPVVWSVGKIQRYYQSDVDDLLSVLRRKKPNPSKLVRTWARALRESPRSSASNLFVKTAEDFLRTYGRQIWGTRFDPEKYLSQFRKNSIKASS